MKPESFDDKREMSFERKARAGRIAGGLIEMSLKCFNAASYQLMSIGRDTHVRAHGITTRQA